MHDKREYYKGGQNGTSQRGKKNLYCLVSPNTASMVVGDSIFILDKFGLLMKGFTRRENEIFP